MRIPLAIVFLSLPALAIADVARAQTTSRRSVSSAGVQGNLDSVFVSISGNGRYVAFESLASNLVAGDTNGAYDVFVHDRQTGATSRVSVDSGGLQANSDCILPSISADGRFVAFTSFAANLVAGDTNAAGDIFIHDRQTGVTSRASVSTSGAQANDSSFSAALSADARFVAFTSLASNLVLGDSNGEPDVFVRDRAAGTTTRVSVGPGGIQGNGICSAESISADGRFVAFTSLADNLVTGDSNGVNDVFVHDRATGSTTRVSVDSSGGEGNDNSGRPSISADGRFVAFHSGSTAFVPGDANADEDVFVHDRSTGETSLVSVDSAGIQGDHSALTPSISADGRFVAFGSGSTRLVRGDTNGTRDIFVHDRYTGQTVRASVDSAGVEANAASAEPAISGDGRYVAFVGDATNLVAGDTNGASDVFVRELRDPAECRAGTVNSGAGPVADVLTINGETGIVTVAAGDPLSIELDAAPLGPDPARYFALAWVGFPSHPLDVTIGGASLGCMVNPTPLSPLAAPQALKCLRGAGMPSGICRGIVESRAPARAPFRLSKNGGLAGPLALTLQAVLEDDGAGNPRGFSVTNAVTLVVE